MLHQVYVTAFCWLREFSSLMQEREMALFFGYIYIYMKYIY